MAQYAYMLATLPPIGPGTDLRQASALRTIARALHELCVSEMAHLATACNLLVAHGGAPHFAEDALGARHDAAGRSGAAEARLAPLSDAEVACLLEQETRGAGARLPVFPYAAVAADAVDPRPAETPGHMYRRVFYEICRRKHCGDGRFVAKCNGWSPFYLMSDPPHGTPIYPADAPSTYTYDVLLRAIHRVLVEGEGGPGGVAADERAHVVLLARIRASMPILGTALPSPVVTNPNRDDAALGAVARHLLGVDARLYELILSTLYLLWRGDIGIERRRALHGRLTGLMSSGYACLGALLAATPVREGAGCRLGPAFSAIDAVPTPASGAEGWAGVDRSLRRLRALLGAGVPRAAGSTAAAEAGVARLARILDAYATAIAAIKAG